MVDVDLELLPAQREFIDSDAETVAFVGGYGSGKTRGLVYKSLLLGLRNAPCMQMYVMPTYTLLRDAVVPTFQEVFADLKIPYRYVSNDHDLYIENGPQSFKVLLRSGDRPESLVGSNLGSLLIDEPALQDEEVFKRTIARVRDPRAKLLQTALGGTPEGNAGWFFDLCHKASTHVIRARTTDNVFLPESYVRNLAEKFTAEEYRAYINGEFVSFDGSWYQKTPGLARFEDWNGVRIFRQPSDCSRQLVLGVDTGGGVDRDSCALALVDKRDSRLVASWKSSIASIAEMTALTKLLVAKYTRTLTSTHPGILPDRQELGPLAIIEKNGIGQATYQSFLKAGISCSAFSTTEATRYQGLLAVRIAANDGILAAGDDLLEEARLLTVKDGKFVGPKDLSMAIGFAYNHINKHPFIEEATVADRNRLAMLSRLGRGRGHW